MLSWNLREKSRAIDEEIEKVGVWYSKDGVKIRNLRVLN